MINNNNEVKTEEKQNIKRSIAIRNIVVILTLLIVSIILLISFRAEYLNIKEIGEKYIDIFIKNINNKLYLAGGIFIITYLIIYISNKIAKHGLKKFFADDKKDMPKLPNKSFATIGALITSIIGMIILNQKYTMFANIAWFGRIDPVFHSDIGYYIFYMPFIENVISFSIVFLIFLMIYIAFYYVVIMNVYLDGVDIETLKKNTFIKQIIAMVVCIALLVSVYIFISSQNILTQEMLTVEGDKVIDLVGAGKTDVTVKLWGYRIFSFVLFIVVARLLRYAKKSNFKQVMISISIIPIYLVVMFLCMVYYDQIIVKNEMLDNQKEYIGYNIENTKEAYGINIEQKSIDSYNTITYEEISENENVINNIPIISSDITKTNVLENQEYGGYYSYDYNFLGKYNSELVYFTPREILSNSNMSYNNRTFKYTHGYSSIISSASKPDENGFVKYIVSEFEDSNSQIKQPRIYFGLETNSTIITKSKFGNEYDYPLTATKFIENEYDGQAGLKLNFLDRLILTISNKDFKLAFSTSITNDSKIVSNRNIIERAKTLLPFITYDDNPYFVIDDEGNIIWVLDGYTTSDQYPYSQTSLITVNGQTKKINYIRNSVKVLINSYDGTMKFYITDRTDPIIMSYANLYPSLFQGLEEEIPDDISSQFMYPKLLYKVQVNMMNIYHNISEDVLYRADDIWEITPTVSSSNTKVIGEKMEPYYTMLKKDETKEPELGLVVTFNRQSKQNIIAYAIGEYQNGKPELSLYKFDSGSNVAGIVQINSQIEQDETISSELATLEVTGTKLIKNIIIVPINNTLLYVEPVFQVRLNESEVPILKKVIVASGNKLAIGDNLNEAILNLFTDYAVNFEIVDIQDINSVIDAIIKSNNNLYESLNTNNFEMIGKDLSELENLIKRLEELRKIEIMKQEKDNKEEEIIDENESSEQVNSVQNDISSNIINNITF